MWRWLPCCCRTACLGVPSGGGGRGERKWEAVVRTVSEVNETKVPGRGS